MVSMEVEVLTSPMDIDDEGRHEVRNNIWGNPSPFDVQYMHISQRQKVQACNNKIKNVQLVPVLLIYSNENLQHKFIKPHDEHLTNL